MLCVRVAQRCLRMLERNPVFIVQEETYFFSVSKGPRDKRVAHLAKLCYLVIASREHGEQVFPSLVDFLTRFGDAVETVRHTVAFFGITRMR